VIIHVGTSGYGYKEWKGAFYPERIPAREMLRFYAGRLCAVEINYTFYHMPTEKVLFWPGRNRSRITLLSPSRRRRS
jgi:uncharacterized protein YecE (DUF72 family)